MLFFNWLRRKTTEAVLGGFADAAAVAGLDGEAPPLNVEELRKQFAATLQTKQLTAGEEEEEPATGRKRR